MNKLTQDQIETLQEEIKAWKDNLNDSNWYTGRSTDEKFALEDGIFILLEVLGIDDDGIQSALDEVL